MNHRPLEPGDAPAEPGTTDDEQAGATVNANDRGFRRALEAFAHRNYAIYWIGGLLSNIARWMLDVTVPYVIYQLTSSAGLVGVAAFARLVPGVVVAPIAGSIADRFHRQAVLIVTHLGLAAVTFGYWIAWTADVATPTVIIGLSVLSGIVVGLNLPAWHAFVPELVPRDHLFGAITLNSAQINVAKAVGPGIAGVILATAGTAWAFLVTALFFASVTVVIGLIRVPRRPKPVLGQRMLAQFMDVLRHARGHPTLAVSGLVMLTIAVLGMPVFQLTAVFATDVFRVGPTGFGILAGALGLGGAATAPVLAGWMRGISRRRLIGASMLWYGVMLIAFAHSTLFPIGVVAMAMVGGAFIAVNSTISTTVQLVVDDDIRGRIVALYLTGFALAYPLGSLVQGWIAEQIGAPATVTGAGALMVCAAIWFLANATVRASMDRSAPVAGAAAPEALTYDDQGIVQG